jgi:hypothetical protein
MVPENGWLFHKCVENASPEQMPNKIVPAKKRENLLYLRAN